MGQGLAGTEQVLEGELLQVHESEALAAEVGVGVEILVGTAVGQQIGVAFARGESAGRELRHLRRGESRLHLGVGAE